jgi:hemerythrin-like metal-binding protein
MDQFYWSESFSVHDEELDSHHRKLIALFNSLYDCFLNSADSAAIGQIIQELMWYADYHFRAEERYMALRDYAGIDAHRAEHLFFIKKVSNLQSRNFMDDPDVSRELVIYLGNWLINHVIREDRKYAV